MSASTLPYVEAPPRLAGRHFGHHTDQAYALEDSYDCSEYAYEMVFAEANGDHANTLRQNWAGLGQAQR